MLRCKIFFGLVVVLLTVYDETHVMCFLWNFGFGSAAAFVSGLQDSKKHTCEIR